MSRDKRLQDRSIYPHWCTDTVRFSDQDAAGHVNNVAICAYLETARLTFMRDMGLSHAVTHVTLMPAPCAKSSFGGSGCTWSGRQRTAPA